ncbi:MAG: hypothetical protein WA156_01800 [Methylocystis silviterrae]
MRFDEREPVRCIGARALEPEKDVDGAIRAANHDRLFAGQKSERGHANAIWRQLGTLSQNWILRIAGVIAEYVASVLDDIKLVGQASHEDRCRLRAFWQRWKVDRVESCLCARSAQQTAFGFEAAEADGAISVN